MDKDFSRKRNMFCIFLYSSLKNRKKGHNNKVLNIYSGDNILSEYKTVGSWSLTFRKNYINGIGTDSVIAYEAEEQISPTSTGKVMSRYYYHKKPILFKYGFLWVLYWAIMLVLFILLEHQVFYLILSHTYQLIHLYFLQ